MRNNLLLPVFGLSLVAATVTIPAADTRPIRQTPCEMHQTVKVSMRYLLYLPEDYKKQKSWPLLLFLHGSGERGYDLEKVKKHGPPKLVEEGRQFPFIVVSPQCPDDHWWEPFELTALLNDIVKRHKVDQDRIYITGLSMGGFGTWALAAHTPDRFAALVPVCGAGETVRTKSIAHIPIWVFHGAKDQAVPIERSQKMVDVLKKRGANVQFTIYPEAGHDSWTETYANPKLYEWLLQQKRMPAPKTADKR